MKPPATQKNRDMRSKLEALVERGFNGERLAAEKKLKRYLDRYDWTSPKEGPDIFAGTFTKLPGSTGILPFANEDLDIGMFVKWSIEITTKIPCSFKNRILCVETTGSTARRLADIALAMQVGLLKLWEQYASTPGARACDRGNFLLGLYEGMMNEVRSNEALPSRIVPKVKLTRSRKAVAIAPGLSFHPYTLAVPLGRQIRVCTPLETIAGELDQKIKGEIACQGNVN